MRKIPLFKVFMNKDVSLELDPVLQSGYIGQGPKVEEFEKRLADFFENPFVNTLNSATSGLTLALHMLKDGVRDEVLTTPLTCTATNWPILENGLKIKWVDLDPNTCNVSLEDIRKKIGPKTLAIMVVHWGGYPVDLNELKNIQDECFEKYGHRPMVIEDCAHAMGSIYKENMIGNHGNICVFSFQAIKHLTTGDGGAIVSPNKEFHERAKLLRWYGLDRTSSADFRCEQNIKEWGFKYHMNDIAATIGLSNFRSFRANLYMHQVNAEEIRIRSTSNVDGLRHLESKEDRLSASWIMTVLVDRRDDFMTMMKSKGIDVGRVHDRNDKHECVSQFKIDLPNTDKVCSEICCIPCGWWMNIEDIDYMVDCIKGGW